MRSLCGHPHYVNVLCVCTSYVGVGAAALLHNVISCCTSSHDCSSSCVLFIVVCTILWSKDNNKDLLAGVNTLSCSNSLLLAVLLVILSEAALFVSILWCVLVVTLTHSAYDQDATLLWMHHQ